MRTHWRTNLKIQITAFHPRTIESESVEVESHHYFKGTDSNAEDLF